MIPVNKIREFHHGLSSNDAECIALQNEMARLRLSPYITMEKEFYDFIKWRTGLLIISFNCQSLKAHANYLSNRVFQHVNVLMLSETLIKENEPSIAVRNFDFKIRFQRSEKRNSGVAIYQNVADKNDIIKSHLDIKALYKIDREQITSMKLVHPLFKIRSKSIPKFLK